MEAKMKTEAHIPMRKCVGCGKSLPQNNLIRIVLKDNHLIVDISRKAHGRGVYISRDESIIRQAFKKKSFNRVFRRDFSSDELESLGKELTALVKS